jgi:hypothetical protein
MELVPWLWKKCKLARYVYRRGLVNCTWDNINELFWLLCICGLLCRALQFSGFSINRALMASREKEQMVRTCTPCRHVVQVYAGVTRSNRAQVSIWFLFWSCFPNLRSWLQAFLVMPRPASHNSLSAQLFGSIYGGDNPLLGSTILPRAILMRSRRSFDSSTDEPAEKDFFIDMPVL